MTVVSYLRLAIKDEYLDEFQRDLDEMLALVKSQPGFYRAEVLQTRHDPNAFVILSEWEDRDHIRAWEHSPRHEEIMRRYEDRYREDVRTRKYTPL